MKELNEGGKTLKRILIYLVSFIVIAMLGFFIYVKTHPPLRSGGASYHNNHAPPITVEIENDGFAPLHIKNVLIDNNKVPPKALLGISRNSALVQLPDTPTGVEFYSKLNSYPINPKIPPKKATELLKNKNNKTIFHYGIAVYYKNFIRKVIIKYNYLGLPFKKEIDITRYFES